MSLGCFSVSLTVKDLKASKTFYETLGFEKFGGDEAHNYLILKNGDAIIGLYQDMFEANILTFNPGWNTNAQPVETFEDVRHVQDQLKAAGVDMVKAADPEGTGPDHIIFTDPDGNTIMFDQHVDKP
ncbi:VOC family protein [Celeribacter sp.]|uniref:VOC family protein n=1 Tax=Celeribacter sp. TaxID=1890673 RepID=UPI003A8FA5F1